MIRDWSLDMHTRVERNQMKNILLYIWLLLQEQYFYTYFIKDSGLMHETGEAEVGLGRGRREKRVDNVSLIIQCCFSRPFTFPLILALDAGISGAVPHKMIYCSFNKIFKNRRSLQKDILYLITPPVLERNGYLNFFGDF